MARLREVARTGLRRALHAHVGVLPGLLRGRLPGALDRRVAAAHGPATRRTAGSPDGARMSILGQPARLPGGLVLRRAGAPRTAWRGRRCWPLLLFVVWQVPIALARGDIEPAPDGLVLAAACVMDGCWPRRPAALRRADPGRAAPVAPAVDPCALGCFALTLTPLAAATCSAHLWLAAAFGALGAPLAYLGAARGWHVGHIQPPHVAGAAAAGRVLGAGHAAVLACLRTALERTGHSPACLGVTRHEHAGCIAAADLGRWPR